MGVARCGSPRHAESTGPGCQPIDRADPADHGVRQRQMLSRDFTRNLHEAAL